MTGVQVTDIRIHGTSLAIPFYRQRTRRRIRQRLVRGQILCVYDGIERSSRTGAHHFDLFPSAGDDLP